MGGNSGSEAADGIISVVYNGRSQAINALVTLAQNAICSSVWDTGTFEIGRLAEYYNTQVMKLLQSSVEHLFCEAEVQGILNAHVQFSSRIFKLGGDRYGLLNLVCIL